MSELAPYRGPWTRRHATHLLTRAGFGAHEPEILAGHDAGLEQCLTQLLTPQVETQEFDSTQALLRRAAMSSGSIAGLKSWWLYRMINSANPLAEKMALFWHNHFATSWAKVKSTAAMAEQNDLIRRHALGNFRQLAQGMARDVAMLEWLDGNANRKRQPNENFARELMELFTLGEGNYSETDIKQAARAFSGWHVRRDKYWFNERQHDGGQKTVFGRTGAFGGTEIVDLCLDEEACPRFLAGKLLRAFVTPKPAEKLIAALGGRIRFHGFDLRRTLDELLRSEVFFAPENRRSLIKSPVDLVAGTGRTLGLRAKLTECTQLMAELGQNLFEPPTVKGWEGGRLWINSATMLQRANFAAGTADGQGFGTLGRQLPEGAAAIAELLLASDLPAPTMRAAAKQPLPGQLQFFMSLPEYQLT